MAWRDLLEPASFRGVRFYVDSNDMTAGRRTATHEYPKRDKPFVEDMGRASRTITFDAYVLGSEYVTAKNALLDAIEAEGAGELVHPLYGVRNVQAGVCTVRETKAEGGMARFSLEFTETGDALYPVGTTDAATAVSMSADSSLVSAEASFLESFSIDGLPQWGVDKARDLLAGAATIMESAFAPLKANADDLAKLNQDVIRLQDEAANLVRSPSDLAETVRLLMGSVASSASTPASGVSALLGFYDSFSSETESVSTPTRQQVDQNRRAMDDYLHQVAVIEAVRIAPGQDFVSLSAAETQRDLLGDLLDDQADAASDDVYNSLTALRADMVQAIPDPASRLPDIVNITLAQTTPAVVLAYRLYEDATRDAEIVARNDIRHPSFVPGGVPLEVLTSE